jgi:hypothetical protein
MDIVRLSSLVCTVALALAGCRPTCTAACTKVRSCDLTAELTQQECEAQCGAQQAEVDSDAEADALWGEHLSCIASASCDEIAAGACYDAELFAF